MNTDHSSQDPEPNNQCSDQGIDTIERKIISATPKAAPASLKSQIWNELPFECRSVASDSVSSQTQISKTSPARSKWYLRSDVLAFGTAASLLLFAISFNLFVNQHNSDRLYDSHRASVEASQLRQGTLLATSTQDSDLDPNEINPNQKVIGNSMVNQIGHLLGISSVSYLPFDSTQLHFIQQPFLRRKSTSDKRNTNTNTPVQNINSSGAFLCRENIYHV